MRTPQDQNQPQRCSLNAGGDYNFVLASSPDIKAHAYSTYRALRHPITSFYMNVGSFLTTETRFWTKALSLLMLMLMLI